MRISSARCTHAHITRLYIMSIQPVNKAQRERGRERVGEREAGGKERQTDK